MAATDPGELIDRWVGMWTGIFLRFLPILPVLREAANTEPVIGVLWRQNAIDNRYADTWAVANRLHDLGALPQDLSVDRATDVLWTYASFDTPRPSSASGAGRPRPTPPGRPGPSAPCSASVHRPENNGRARLSQHRRRRPTIRRHGCPVA
jgi:hypothetical protein